MIRFLSLPLGDAGKVKTIDGAVIMGALFWNHRVVTVAFWRSVGVQGKEDRVASSKASF